MIKVNGSTSIDSFEYISENHTLTVVFKRGSVYEYKDVPQEVYTEFYEAESKGKAFDRLIRKGGYKYRSVK